MHTACWHRWRYKEEPDLENVQNFRIEDGVSIDICKTMIP